MAEERRVEPLKKVSLGLKIVDSASGIDTAAQPLTFEFIYGIGSGGLSPFEMELGGKREGEEILIPMTGEQMPSFFQHLHPPPLCFPDPAALSTLKARIEAVSEPDPREVIKAMAEAAECGNHCCGH